MSIEVALTGNGTFAGARSNLTDYSVSEEATPLDIADTSGSTGTISFQAIDDPNRKGSVLLAGTGVVLTDTERGSTSGNISDISGNDGQLSVTADTRLGALVTTVDANAVNATFTSVLTYYLGLAGVTGDISVDSTIGSKTVVAPGWKQQDLWTRVKQLCAAYGAEIVQIGNVITVRPPRTQTLDTRNGSPINWQTTEGELAREVEVSYYNSSYKSNFLVHPEGGWTPETEVYTVEAGETITVNIPVNMYIASVEQPVVVDAVGKTQNSPSVYSVSGADGFAIKASQWTADGGKMTVAIGEDGTSLDVTMTGAGGASAKYAPYRIARSSADGSYYSSLRLRATGVYFLQESVVMQTGALPNAVGGAPTSIDNPFVRTLDDAMALAQNASMRYSGATKTVSGSIAKKSSAFGNVVGARLPWRRSIYRVKSVTITPTSVDYTAESDTTFGDFEASATGMTFAQFETSYSGMTFEDFSLAPLPKVESEYDRY